MDRIFSLGVGNKPLIFQGKLKDEFVCCGLVRTKIGRRSRSCHFIFGSGQAFAPLIENHDMQRAGILEPNRFPVKMQNANEIPTYSTSR